MDNKKVCLGILFNISASRSILFLLVELMLLLVLFDDSLVSFFEVFGQDDIPVLTHCQHASLRQQGRK